MNIISQKQSVQERLRNGPFHEGSYSILCPEMVFLISDSYRRNFNE